MKKVILFLILCSFSFLSCDYFNREIQEDAVARVKDSYLYKSDLQKLVTESTSPEDSTIIVSNYINRWATQQLLLEQAEINLSADKLVEFEKLVTEYHNDLLTEAYKNVIVGRQVDSIISNAEYLEFYKTNSENFKINDVLVKMRYVYLPKDYADLANVKEKFQRFNKKDKADLNTMDFQFVSYNFNDSVWVKKENMLNAIPLINMKGAEVLKKSNFSQLQDSLGVYLVKIENILNPNDIAPISYIKPTLKQIILNKRKLELIKKLEADITKDAIKKKNFEIYKNE